MCSCEFNFTCSRHREPNPDLPDGDDPYNETTRTTISPSLPSSHPNNRRGRMATSESAPKSRELAVSVTAVFDLAYIERMYVEALTPDGGWSGTLNQYIREWADSVERDMRGIMHDCTYESGWTLRPVPPSPEQEQP